MADLPIIMSGPMVRAILREIENPGTGKTMTRRLAWRPWSEEGLEQAMQQMGPEVTMDRRGSPTLWQRVKPGDRLWVRHSYNLFPVYFRPIHGWDDLYAAGTDGLIYRTDNGEPRPLRGTPTSKGYLSVSLSRDGIWKTHAVHKLVCRTFYGEAPETGLEVRHMDGNRTNNLPGNLDWGSNVDNWSDRRALRRGIHGEHHAAKLDESAAAAIRVSTASQRALAKEYGVSQSTIGEIKTGKTWRTETEPPKRNLPAWEPWRAPIHMPRWASRLTLIVTATKIERVLEISEADAMAEGVERLPVAIGRRPQFGVWLDDGQVIGPADTGAAAFRLLWLSLHGAESSRANPEVVALTFTPRLANIDALEEAA